MSELKKCPVEINAEITDEIFFEAGRLKATYRISFADSIALAQAKVFDGELLTSDHHEFDAVESQETIRFLWIREKSSDAQAWLQDQSGNKVHRNNPVCNQMEEN